MNLQKNTLYHATVSGVKFGRIPMEDLIVSLASGRQCGVLLEQEIASYFDDCTAGTQGAGADLIDQTHGKIQAKTYRSVDLIGQFKLGPRRGLSKSDDKRIFTTKSGLWDSIGRRRALGEDIEQTICEYFLAYDCFCYIDIAKMRDLEYSFIVVDSSVPINSHVDGRISYNDILNSVEQELTLDQ
jgi:hypothetical protein